MSSTFVLDDRLQADTHAVIDLTLSRVLLMDDARFAWLILVPRIADVRELTELSATAQSRLLVEINLAASVLTRLHAPDKLNIAALGNVVAQLHVHVIARRVGDAAWPRPVWGDGVRQPYAATAARERVAALRDGFAIGDG
jgi:diadenosine tetraphosphate (Ap4A) HIT family hydrolase